MDYLRSSRLLPSFYYLIGRSADVQEHAFTLRKFFRKRSCLTGFFKPHFGLSVRTMSSSSEVKGTLSVS